MIFIDANGNDAVRCDQCGCTDYYPSDSIMNAGRENGKVVQKCYDCYYGGDEY